MNEEIKPFEIPEGTEMISLPARPLKPRPKEHTELARMLAKRYLTVPMLEKMIAQKKKSKEKKAADRFKPPVTPEEFYERGQRYLDGALCAASFQEQSKYYQRSAEMFAGAGEYQDAPQLAEQYGALAQKVLEDGYRDAYQKAAELKTKATSADGWFHAARAFERIESYRDAAAQAEECERRHFKLRSARHPMVAVAVVLAVVLAVAGVRYTKTDSFKVGAAKAAYSVGLDSVATTLLKNTADPEAAEDLLVQVRYDNALNHIRAGRFDNAVKILKACGDYQDSAELLRQSSYHAGMEAFREGDWKEAQKLLFTACGYEDADEYLLQAEKTLLNEAVPGDHVNYGGCECILLDVKDRNALLLSAKLYGQEEEVTFHQQQEAVSWADCTMRSVLNSSYLEEHFTPGEQAELVPTETEDGCSDRVFLLSSEEYLRYQEIMGEKKALWWLRDSGDQPDTAVFVSCDGTLMEHGYPVDSTAIQGRPAFWVAK